MANFNIQALREYMRQEAQSEITLSEPIIPSRLPLDDPKVVGFVDYLMQIFPNHSVNNPMYLSEKSSTEVEQSLFAALLDCCHTDYPPQEVMHLDPPQPSYLHQAEKHLKEHLLEPVFMTTLSDHVGVSSRTLSRTFKKKYGIGPMRLLKSTKMKAAFQELRNAPHCSNQVMNVAFKYGSYSLGPFAKECREMFEELPSQTLDR